MKFLLFLLSFSAYAGFPPISSTNSAITTLPGQKIQCNTSSASQFGCLSSSDWTSFNSKMANPAFTVSQTVYVAVGGNDTTGDGSIGNPFQTVSKALSVITTAGSNNRFMIKLMGGKIVDTITPLLKPWVYIVGDHEDGTYWKVTASGTNIGLDPTFATVGGARFGLANVYLGGGTNLNLDLNTIGPSTGTPSAIVDIENVYITGGFNFYGRAPDIDFVQGKGIFVFGTFNADAAQVFCNGCVFQGPANLTSNVAASNSQYSAGVFQSAVTISGSFANAEQITANTMFSTLTVSGASTVLTADAVSLPPKSSQTISSGGTITLLGDAYNLKYTPTTPANWLTTPTSVLGALDLVALASKIASATTSGLLSNTDWSTFNAKQPAGNYITGLTGDVVATGPGSVGATIQANVVSNSKLAQMSANTIKGNNTGATANAVDLTGSQVTAMLSPFVGDTGSGGTQGLVPAPTAGQAELGNFLSAGGAFSFVDTSKPRFPSFKLFSQTALPAGLIKAQDVTVYTYQNNTYAMVSGGNSVGTISIYNVTNPASPQLRGSITLAGSYGAIVYFSAGVPWAIVPSSGATRLYTVNLSNPNSLTLGGNLLITNSPGSLYSCFASNGYVYISTQNQGLTVVDIGGGTGTMLFPVQTFQEGSVKSFGALVSGTTLYTTNYATAFPATVRYLKTWSLATPATPSLQNTYTIPGGPVATSTKPASMSISGNTLIVSDINQNVFHLIDVSTPTAPNYLSYVTPSASIQPGSKAQFSGNYVYLSSGNNSTYGGVIDFVDISNRSAPVKIATATNGVATAVYGGAFLNGGYIYAANYGVAPGSSGSLDIYSNPFESLTAGSVLLENLTSVGSITGTVNFTPATPSNWSTVPTTVKGALDTLAASISGTPVPATRTVTGSTTITSADRYVFINSASSASVTLPSATPDGQVYTIKSIGSGSVSITPNGTDTIDGVNAAVVINHQYTSYSLVSTGGSWFIW